MILPFVLLGLGGLIAILSTPERDETPPAGGAVGPLPKDIHPAFGRGIYDAAGGSGLVLTSHQGHATAPNHVLTDVATSMARVLAVTAKGDPRERRVVLAFQRAWNVHMKIALKPDGLYGPRTASASLMAGVDAGPPRYWPRDAAERKRAEALYQEARRRYAGAVKVAA